MDFAFSDKNLESLQQKLAEGKRLSLEDGLTLYKSHDLMGIGWLADRVRTNMHGKKGYFVYNQHINYTNVCLNRCRF